MIFSLYVISTLLVYLSQSGFTLAFTTSSIATRNSLSTFHRSGVSPLKNVPPPGIDADPQTIKEAADRESPPQSFFQLQVNCARAAELAIRDGHKLLEIEFPPLPAQVLEMDDVSAYEVAEANFKLALDFAKSFAAKAEDTWTNSGIKIPTKTAILFPDDDEFNIAIENMKISTTPYPGVIISSLRRSDPDDFRWFKPEQIFRNVFSSAVEPGSIKPLPVDMYIILVASTQELPDVEELHRVDPDKIICFYNLKLDVLRGDLGAPAFPPQEFQDRFLSRVKPVYYLRTRQYSRSVSKAPFLINYQGCLFRSYPGEFQTLLDTGTGRYRRVCGNKVRPALGEFKEQLTKALIVDGVMQEESKTINFLRTGYKTTTWWEEERLDASDSWKT
jgi:hypothetical protein